MNEYINERLHSVDLSVQEDLLLSTEDIKGIKSLANNIYEHADHRWKLIEELITYCLMDVRAMNISCKLIPLYTFDEKPLLLLKKLRGLYAQRPEIEPTTLRERFFKYISFPYNKLIDVDKLKIRIESITDEDINYIIESKLEDLVNEILQQLGAMIYYE